MVLVSAREARRRWDGHNTMTAIAKPVAGLIAKANCEGMAAFRWSMIPKNGNRFSEKIMLNQEAKA
jgi:hypothetical protein